jgi:hypothetical protein
MANGVIEVVPTNQAAALLGMQPQTLRLWRLKGTGPRYVRYGGPRGRVVYRVSDLESWLAGRVFNSTSEEGVANAG